MMLAYVSLFVLGTLGALAAQRLLKPQPQPVRVRVKR